MCVFGHIPHRKCCSIYVISRVQIAFHTTPHHISTFKLNVFSSHVFHHITPKDFTSAFTSHHTTPFHITPQHSTSRYYHTISHTGNIATHYLGPLYSISYIAVCLPPPFHWHHHISSTYSTSHSPHLTPFHTTPTFSITAHFTPYHSTAPYTYIPPHLDSTSHHHVWHHNTLHHFPHLTTQQSHHNSTHFHITYLSTSCIMQHSTYQDTTFHTTPYYTSQWHFAFQSHSTSHHVWNCNSTSHHISHHKITPPHHAHIPLAPRHGHHWHYPTAHIAFQLSSHIRPCLIWRQTIPHHSVFHILHHSTPPYSLCSTLSFQRDIASPHFTPHLTLHDITFSRMTP